MSSSYYWLKFQKNHCGDKVIENMSIANCVNSHGQTNVKHLADDRFTIAI